MEGKQLPFRIVFDRSVLLFVVTECLVWPCLLLLRWTNTTVSSRKRLPPTWWQSRNWVRWGNDNRSFCHVSFFFVFFLLLIFSSFSFGLKEEQGRKEGKRKSRSRRAMAVTFSSFTYTDGRVMSGTTYLALFQPEKKIRTNLLSSFAVYSSCSFSSLSLSVLYIVVLFFFARTRAKVKPPTRRNKKYKKSIRNFEEKIFLKSRSIMTVSWAISFFLHGHLSFGLLEFVTTILTSSASLPTRWIIPPRNDYFIIENLKYHKKRLRQTFWIIPIFCFLAEGGCQFRTAVMLTP